MLPSLDEHHLLLFWVQLLVIVVVARFLGNVAKRIGQPAVVGELAAGMILGPSVLGALAPGAFRWLFPPEPVQAAMLTTVGWLGVAFLLVLTGFETDLAIIRRLGKAAAFVTIGALGVPFVLGLGVGTKMPGLFVGQHATRLVFVLFMATALSISSLPVIAKILGELGLMRRNFGQVTVAVGMANDIVGWLVLGVVAGIARTGSFELTPFLATLMAMAVLLGGALTVGQRVVDAFLRRIRARTDSPIEAVGGALLIALVFAAFAQAAHIEAVLGVFVAGVVLGRSRFQHPAVESTLEAVTHSLLAPVFFATAGLRLDLGALANRTVVEWSGVVLVAAVIGKFAGAWAGARAARLDNREGLALGTALNARGAVEVVIATVGLSVGALNGAAYTVIVLMAIATSMMAPPLLRLVVRGWSGTAEEQERLEREETLSRNLLVRPGRILLATDGGPGALVAAQVLNFAWPSETGITVLHIGDLDGDVDVDLTVFEPLQSVFADRDIDIENVAEDDIAQAILDEAKLGYDAVVVGIEHRFSDDRVLSPILTRLLAATTVPLVIVRRPKGLTTATPSAFTRVVVPVTGSPASRRAQEIGFHVSRELGTEVVLTHVLAEADEEAADRVDSLMDTARALASDLGASTTSVVRTSPSPAAELADVARTTDADVVIIGATVRRVDGEAFLGHTSEHLLEHVDATVVVVTMPDAIPDPVGVDPEATAAGNDEPAELDGTTTAV